MEAEHAEIDPLLAACAEGFARLASHADDDARAALAVRLVATRESLARHLAHEETDAMAILQRLMTQEDWARARRGVLQAGPGVPPVVASCRGRRTACRARCSTASSPRAGLGFKLVWLATRRRFAVREERAFRYA